MPSTQRPSRAMAKGLHFFNMHPRDGKGRMFGPLP